jgi:hypothetical protein
MRPDSFSTSQTGLFDLDGDSPRGWENFLEAPDPLQSRLVQWPPPPQQGLLCAPQYSTLPQEEWGTDEWKAYALCLESKGLEIAARLNADTRQQVAAAIRALPKLPKRKQNGSRGRTVTGLLDLPAKARGRGRPRRLQAISDSQAAELYLKVKKSVGRSFSRAEFARKLLLAYRDGGLLPDHIDIKGEARNLEKRLSDQLRKVKLARSPSRPVSQVLRKIQTGSVTRVEGRNYK